MGGRMGEGNVCRRWERGREQERALIIFFPLYLYFADMASHVYIVNPTCPEWGNVITQKNMVKFKSVRIKTTSGIMS
jgi:hypothetical protein